MRVSSVIVATILVASHPMSAAPVSAWGFDAHKFIVDRAIDLLPPPIRPFYEKHRVFVVEHCIDPDLWRQVGFEDEPPRHFLDLDAYGTYPFTELPRDYGAAVAKFGRDTVVRNGLLPWRVAEVYNWLLRALRAQHAGNSPFAVNDVKFLSAVIAHYLSDAHVPFHAVLNYDGQLTNQHGIHSRFEAELFRRFRQQLSIKPPARVNVRQPRDFVFETLLSGFRLVDPVLRADRQAIGSRDYYDDRYFDAFLAATRPILERRLSESITAVASILTGAWEEAGKPVLPLDAAPPTERVRRTSGQVGQVRQ